MLRLLGLLGLWGLQCGAPQHNTQHRPYEGYEGYSGDERTCSCSAAFWSRNRTCARGTDGRDDTDIAELTSHLEGEVK
jgi:hypothetical protein